MATVLQLAGMLPRDPQFRAFVGYFMVPVRDDVSVDEATTFIRDACGVESRRELATNTEAQQSFHNFIRKPFVQWRERQEEHA
ncbi:hypothetical protein A9R05_07440 [Burkholderia sp. KK1]|nr:hypothetical protein A9R05_07190 [Burkholderia sp. KK1]AQG98687.1 hypothetical protein A9R05_07440 [Burkholderia sp. KK1]